MFEEDILTFLYIFVKKKIVMVPTLRTIMNFSNYYEYCENIHLGVKLIPA